MWATVIGVALAVVFGFLWIRQVTREVRGEPEPVEGPAPEPVELPTSEEGPVRYTRSKFLEGATIGLGAAIGAIVTLPVLGFAVAPAFVDQDYRTSTSGRWTTIRRASGRSRPSRRAPERRRPSRGAPPSSATTACKDDVPSFTDPLQPLRAPRLPDAAERARPASRARSRRRGAARVTPTQPSGFGCPCHGGAYDTEGNRTAGPPVRALDRFEYSIVDGNLCSGAVYSVAEVEGRAPTR